jgi:hypothetical protein
MAESIIALALAVAWTEWRLKTETKSIHSVLAHLWKHHLEDHDDDAHD